MPTLPTLCITGNSDDVNTSFALSSPSEKTYILFTSNVIIIKVGQIRQILSISTGELLVGFILPLHKPYSL